jgi:hypothetical protein
LIAETLGNLRSIGITVIFVAVASIMTLYVGRDILGRTIVIKNIVVPEQLQKLGYTGDTVIQRLLAEIDSIRESNKFGKTLTPLSSTLASPDIIVPKTGISLRSLVALGRHGDIVGEIVVRPQSAARRRRMV